MAEVKVPKLLHKMSVTAQKAWYNKNKMPLPPHLTGAAGKSAAQAKKDVGEINKQKAKEKSALQKALETSPKQKELKKSSERVRQMASNAMAFGGQRPGGDLTTARGIVSYIRGGGYLKAGRLGEEDSTMNEVTKKEAEKTLGGEVKSKPKMPPGKQPAGYRYVRSLARKAMKAGIKNRDDESEGAVRRAMERELQYNPKYKTEEVEQVDEARRMSAAEKLGKAFDRERERSEASRRRGQELMQQIRDKQKEKENNKVQENVEESTMKYIEEKLTAADPASKWISDFVRSDNPKFAGKSKKERIQQALGAYYAAKRGKNEEFEIEEAKKMEKMEKDDEEYDEEDMDEAYVGFKKLKAKIAAKGGARNPAAVAAGKKMSEEVEQVDEVKAVKAYDKKGKLVGRYRSMDHAKQMKPGHTYKVEEEVEQTDEAAKDWKKAFSGVAQKNLQKDVGKMRSKVGRLNYIGMKPKVDATPKVTAAVTKKGSYSEAVEGKTPETSTEVELAKKHGNPKKITYGDVVKARIEAAKKKALNKGE